MSASGRQPVEVGGHLRGHHAPQHPGQVEAVEVGAPGGARQQRRQPPSRLRRSAASTGRARARPGWPAGRPPGPAPSGRRRSRAAQPARSGAPGRPAPSWPAGPARGDARRCPGAAARAGARRGRPGRRGRGPSRGGRARPPGRRRPRRAGRRPAGRPGGCGRCCAARRPRPRPAAARAPAGRPRPASPRYRPGARSGPGRPGPGRCGRGRRPPAAARRSPSTAPGVTPPGGPGRGAVAGAAQRPTVGLGVPAARIVQQRQAHAHVGGQVVGPAPQHVAVLEQRGQQAGQPAWPTARATRTMRARRGCTGRATISRPASVGTARRPSTASIEGRPARRAAGGLVERPGRRWVEEGQVGHVGAPHGQLQGQPGQVGLADLGLGERPAAACSTFDHRRTATPGPSRPARPARWSADAARRARSPAGSARWWRRTAGGGPGRRRPRSTRPRPSGWSRRCRWRAPPCAGRAGRGQGGVLVVGGQGPVEQVDVDRRRRAALRRAARRCARISPAPGRNTSTSPSGSAQHPWRTAATAPARCARGAGGAPSGPRPGATRLSLVITGAGGPSPPSRAATRSPSRVADMTSRRRSGRRWRRASRARARPRSACRLRSWNSSKITRPTPVEAGIALQAPGEDALGHHLDAGARSDLAVVAGAVADVSPQPGHPTRGHRWRHPTPPPPGTITSPGGLPPPRRRVFSYPPPPGPPRGSRGDRPAVRARSAGMTRCGVRARKRSKARNRPYRPSCSSTAD